ncbi:hypothetical protein BH10PSE7_BH10PSE7_40020 [soil metagenome]
MVPDKKQWRIRASSGGVARRTIDDQYAASWIPDNTEKPWLEIDLGEITTLGGIEVYWGAQGATIHGFESSSDGERWTRLCGTRHGEGGQDVFAFPPTRGRFVRWTSHDPSIERGPEIVEINIYAPKDATMVLETSRASVLGHFPIKLPAGESVTIDFGYPRYPLGAFIEWDETYGTVFSVHLSDDGKTFREVGRIENGDGVSDSFWWRSTTGRFLRLTVHDASSPEGAVINELKLRILNKDRMPIGQLERAALAGRGDLYPQSLLERQVYWTVLGEVGQEEEALFDEYGNLEPRRGSAQITPLLRVDGYLAGAPAGADIRQSLADGSLPIPRVAWSASDIGIRVTAFAHGGQAVVEYLVVNPSEVTRTGTLVLAVRPVQINPYWQHGGHANIHAISLDGRLLSVNDEVYAAFSCEPDAASLAEFNEGDVVRLIEKSPYPTARKLRSDSGLLSAACEFAFSLAPSGSVAFIVSSPMRQGITPRADIDFGSVCAEVKRIWRDKLGPRRISVGDEEVSDTLEAQTALILINATRFAFRPGPRNYDRTWIRDGSSQALALLWAGLTEDAKTYVLWYSKLIYKNGMAPPILNVDGTINRGYGSDIEFDAQGEFVGIAADVFRVSRDRAFLNAIFEPVVRATRFIGELIARTNTLHSPETRFHGLLAPSLSHEGYSKPSYSYWDDFFALSALRNCEYLAREIGDIAIAEEAKANGHAFAANLARSIRLTAKELGKGLMPASADREDVDPTSLAIAFEPCRVDDVLPSEYLPKTYDLSAVRIEQIGARDFKGNYTPYSLRELNASVSLGRFDDAFRLLSVMMAGRRPRGWRHWAEVVWGEPRVADYIGDMPHTWVGAEFATAIRRMLLRENNGVLELFRAVPDEWWRGDGIVLSELPTAFGVVNLTAERDESQVVIELALTGPAPEKITCRYEGAKRAFADGNACVIRGDVIMAPNFQRLVIEF